jgi:hypothetical protein
VTAESRDLDEVECFCGVLLRLSKWRNWCEDLDWVLNADEGTRWYVGSNEPFPFRACACEWSDCWLGLRWEFTRTDLAEVEEVRFGKEAEGDRIWEGGAEELEADVDGRGGRPGLDWELGNERVGLAEGAGIFTADGGNTLNESFR